MKTYLYLLCSPVAIGPKVSLLTPNVLFNTTSNIDQPPWYYDDFDIRTIT